MSIFDRNLVEVLHREVLIMVWIANNVGFVPDQQSTSIAQENIFKSPLVGKYLLRQDTHSRVAAIRSLLRGHVPFFQRIHLIL